MVVDLTKEEEKEETQDALDLINSRFDKLKEFLISYITLGNEFAVGSLKAALEKV